MKAYLAVVSRLHCNLAVVHLNDLLDDVESESQALIRARLPLATLERLENVRQ
jgi:hypothetical protein